MDSQDFEYYTNILNEGANTHSAQPSQVFTNIETATRKTQRTRNFTVEEDNLLISAWLNIGMDAVQGNEQNRATYWKRIYDYYNNFKNFASDRSSNSLMHRWSTIQLSVNKFCGYYSQIETRNQSGVNKQDKIFQAKQMYQSIQKCSFQFLHCWNELRYQPKWLEGGQKRKSRKVKNTSTSASSVPSTPDSISLEEDDDVSDTFVTFERPIGRKASKEMLKRKKNKERVADGTSKSLAVIFEEFKEDKKEMDQKKWILLEKTYVQEEEKLLLEKEKVRKENLREDERLLLEKERVRMEKLREEERIMSIDTSCMPPHLVEYYNQRQMDIITKKS